MALLIVKNLCILQLRMNYCCSEFVTISYQRFVKKKILINILI